MQMTHIFFTDKDPLIVQETINSDLYIDKWFLENGMKTNHSKYQAMVMGYRKVNLKFRCENNIVPNSDPLKMLWLTVDDMLKFDKQVGNICRRVSQQVSVLKRMRNILPFDTRENIYMSSIVPNSISVHKPGISAMRVRLKNWRE